METMKAPALLMVPRLYTVLNYTPISPQMDFFLSSLMAVASYLSRKVFP